MRARGEAAGGSGISWEGSEKGSCVGRIQEREGWKVGHVCTCWDKCQRAEALGSLVVWAGPQETKRPGGRRAGQTREMLKRGLGTGMGEYDGEVSGSQRVITMLPTAANLHHVSVHPWNNLNKKNFYLWCPEYRGPRIWPIPRHPGVGQTAWPGRIFTSFAPSGSKRTYLENTFSKEELERLKYANDIHQDFTN